jgi:hypothetical protein
MRKIYFFLMLMLSMRFSLIAQTRTEDFEIKIPKKKYSNALYNTIRYFDSRKNTSDFGTLLIGRKNILSSVIAKESMDIQISNLMYTSIDSSAKSGSLLFQVNSMKFSETTKYDNDIAIFKLKAKIYSIIDKKCYVIHSIDTSVQANFGGDMSYMIMISASNLISNELAKSLYKLPIDSNFIYSYQIEKLDSLDKIKIPLYSHKILKDGLYKSYETFKLQTPDMACKVSQQEDNSSSAVAIDENGKESSTDGKEIYAVVSDGTGYILVNEKYRRLKKESDDFYYNIDWEEIPEDLKVGNNSSNALFFIPISSGVGTPSLSMALPIGLIIGALNKNKDSEAKKIEIKIDYKTGNPIYSKTKYK